MTVSPYLLMDGALLAPPSKLDEYPEFWALFVAWAADKRVRLGLRTRGALLERYGADWPLTEAPACPEALVGSARRAVNSVLSSEPPACTCEEVPDREFYPAYVADEKFGHTLGHDTALHHSRACLGVATAQPHWATPCAEVKASPGDPAEISLACVPGAELAGERDLRVSAAMTGRRLTVVGGEETDAVLGVLQERFAVAGKDVRWFPSQKGDGPNLGPLEGMKADKDIMICVTGHISHAAREKAVAVSKSRGVQWFYVERASQIPDGVAELLL